MATVSGANYYRGSPGDTVIGTSRNDRLWGTRLFGESGNDYLLGLKTNDYLHGGLGDDVLVGGRGNDLLNGYYGNDNLQSGRGWDRLYGGAGNDYLNGGAGNNRLYGGAGNDVLYAGMPEYQFNGSFGTARTDTLFGGSGADEFNLTRVFSSYYSEGIFNVKPNFAIIKDFSFQEGDRIELPETGMRTGLRRTYIQIIENDTLIKADLITGETIDLALVENVDLS